MAKTIPPEYEFPPEPDLHDLPLNLFTLVRWPILALIRLYQMTIAKGIPEGTCRFYPSCSHYSYQVIYKHGVIKGIPLSIWRVLRCNPYNPGGFDPVP